MNAERHSSEKDDESATQQKVIKSSRRSKNQQTNETQAKKQLKNEPAKQASKMHLAQFCLFAALALAASDSSLSFVHASGSSATSRSSIAAGNDSTATECKYEEGAWQECNPNGECQ